MFNTLKSDGVFIFDVLGGESICRSEKTTKKLNGGVIYEFEHTPIDPITNMLHMDISFKFRDGSKLKSCFSYRWRMWSISDLCDAAKEVGFKKTTVWFPQEDEEAGDGVSYKPVSSAEQKDSWNCYVVCTK